MYVLFSTCFDAQEDPQRRTELLLGGEETEQQKRQAEQRLHEELSQEALNTEQIIKALTCVIHFNSFLLNLIIFPLKWRKLAFKLLFS